MGKEKCLDGIGLWLIWRTTIRFQCFDGKTHAGHSNRSIRIPYACQSGYNK